MHSFKNILIAVIVLCGEAIFSSEMPREEKILSYIQDNLSHCGVLEKTSNGFIYIKVDDAYIRELNDLIKEEGFEYPPYFEERYNQVGAHISVIYTDEMKSNRILRIHEFGHEFCFKPTKCERFHHPNWEDIDEVFVIDVDVPGLDEFRKRYDFPEKRYPFHITIGVKRRSSACIYQSKRLSWSDTRLMNIIPLKALCCY